MPAQRSLKLKARRGGAMTEMVQGSAASAARVSDSYRWTQLAVGVAAMVMIANYQYGWTFFVPDIQKKFGWDRASIQWAFTLFVLFETWLVPVEGWFVDKYGPRLVVVIGGILCAIGLAINAEATTLNGHFCAQTDFLVYCFHLRERRRRRTDGHGEPQADRGRLEGRCDPGHPDRNDDDGGDVRRHHRSRAQRPDAAVLRLDLRHDRPREHHVHRLRHGRRRHLGALHAGPRSDLVRHPVCLRVLFLVRNPFPG